ncbi:MAG: chemotaxis protein CheB, partial [Campylobacter sp.]|nr:chemotaxis protein CheB [Campylobacter sp.]
MKQKLVLIGASTGGPGHLKKLFKNLDINGA